MYFLNDINYFFDFVFRSLVSACTCQSSMLEQPEIQTHHKTTGEVNILLCNDKTIY